MYTTLQVKVFAWSPLGDQFCLFRETFYKSSRQLQNCGAMATKMVATWRVGIYIYIYFFNSFPGPSLIAAFYAEEITLAK